MTGLYALSKRHQNDLVGALKESGFREDEIKANMLEYSYHEFRNEDQHLADQSYQLTGSIGIETDHVDRIDKARSNVNRLIAKGINLEVRHYTRPNEIKPKVLKEASRNARIAANEFAENGRRQGKQSSKCQAGRIHYP